jgi:hypothetical protein
MPGPASNVIAAAKTELPVGFDYIVTYDMGGASTDVLRIAQSVTLASSELARGYAMPIHEPIVDVIGLERVEDPIALLHEAGLSLVAWRGAGSPSMILLSEPERTDTPALYLSILAS